MRSVFGDRASAVRYQTDLSTGSTGTGHVTGHQRGGSEWTLRGLGIRLGDAEFSSCARFAWSVRLVFPRMMHAKQLDQFPVCRDFWREMVWARPYLGQAVSGHLPRSVEATSSAAVCCVCLQGDTKKLDHWRRWSTRWHHSFLRVTSPDSDPRLTFFHRYTQTVN